MSFLRYVYPICLFSGLTVIAISFSLDSFVLFCVGTFILFVGLGFDIKLNDYSRYKS